MRGIKFYAALLGLIFLSLSLSAQESEYKVFYFSGSPKVAEKGKEVAPIRDSYISSKSVLKLPVNSYIVLTNKKEVPMGISTPGSYSIADLNKIYQNVGNSNLTQEFFDYIANNMIQEDQKVRRSGGVYRAVGDILKTPFDEAIVINESIRLDWSNPNAKTMYLKIYDAETWDQPYNLAITDSTFTVVFDQNKFVKAKQYAWTVYHGEDHPQQGTILRVFTFADDAWKNNFDKQLNEIQKGENADMNKMKTLRLFLDNNIFPVEE